MLDKFNGPQWHEWSKLVLKLVMDLRTDNSEESMAHNRENFAKLDLLLISYKPLISVLPVVVSSGLARFTFSLRHCLPNWEPYVIELERVYLEKFKPEKVKQKLRGLREIS